MLPALEGIRFAALTRVSLAAMKLKVVLKMSSIPH